MDKDFKKILDRSSGFQVKAKKSKEDAWNEIDKRLQKKVIPVKMLYGVAAAILISFVIILFTPNNQEVETLAGEQREIFLPDNSKVILNAGSTIKYSEKNWEKKREIKLNGEAFFEIVKGQKMVVNCPNGVVQVLGTSFNVFSRSENFIVECFTGKVKVSNSNEKIVLEPNTGVRLLSGNNQLKKYLVKGRSSKSWISGYSNFENSPLSFVFEEFERQFGYTVNIETDITSRIYTGFFSHDSIKEALETICLPMGISFSIDEKQKIVWIKKSNVSPI